MVRGLCKFFEGPVTAIFSGYVNSMLAEYAKNPGENWKHKDAAIYLVTSLASKAQTQKVLTLMQLLIQWTFYKLFDIVGMIGSFLIFVFFFPTSMESHKPTSW